MAAVEEQVVEVPFGTAFAAKMAIGWYANGAWSAYQIQKTQALSLHPAAHVLHYGSSCFEGLKAYRLDDGGVGVFRLDRHIERMRISAEFLCLPVPAAEMLEEMICATVAECGQEIPVYPGALYIRPTLIGTEANVGAAATSTAEACLYVLLSPVGDYFRGGRRPLRVLIEDEQMRSTPGFGMAKTGGNYASALRHINRAKAAYGVDQVLFCPGGDVQETGASNFLLLNDREILTKPLDSSYLHGVTRDSVLRLGAKLGYRITERDFTVDELLEWIKTGEAALSGTAAVLASVGAFVYRGEEYRVGDGQVGANAERLRHALTAIQSGRAEDDFGWLKIVSVHP